MPHKLYTAGYTGVSPDDLLKATVMLDAILVDIRYSPWSRNSDWHKPSMQERFDERYIHVAELGNVNYNNAAAGIKLEDVERGTIRVGRIIQNQPAILLCACRDHETCHRRIAAEEMQQRYNVEVVHLSADDIYQMCHPPAATQLPLF